MVRDVFAREDYDSFPRFAVHADRRPTRREIDRKDNTSFHYRNIRSSRPTCAALDKPFESRKTAGKKQNVRAWFERRLLFAIGSPVIPYETRFRGEKKKMKKTHRRLITVETVRRIISRYGRSSSSSDSVQRPTYKIVRQI